MRIGAYERYIKSTNTLPDDFDFYKWQCGPSDSVPDGFVRIEGAVAPIVTRGPNKGRRNWKRLDKTSVKAFFVSEEAFKAWCEANDICMNCNNTRKTLARWHKDEGSTYKPCPSCQAVTT